MSHIPSNTTTRTTTDLPSHAQPYANRFLQESFDYFMPGTEWVATGPNGSGSWGSLQGGGIRQYDGPNRTILGFNDQELAAQQAQQQYLSGGAAPGMDQMNQLASDTLSGKYLSPESNPFLTNMYNTAADAVTKNYRDAVAPQQAAQAAMAGAFGGSASANEELRGQYGLGKNLSDMATQLYGQNYANERQMQMQMQQMMPTLGQYNENFWLNRLDRMNALGANRRQLEQQMQDVGYENAMQAWEYPQKAMLTLGQLFGTGATGQSSVQTGPNPNATNAAATYGGLGIAGAGTIFNGINGYNNAGG